MYYYYSCIVILISLINIGMLLVIQKKPTIWQWASIRMKNISGWQVSAAGAPRV